jgi:hypothetical protein
MPKDPVELTSEGTPVEYRDWPAHARVAFLRILTQPPTRTEAGEGLLEERVDVSDSATSPPAPVPGKSD